MAIKVRRGLDIDRLTVILDEGEVAYTTDTKMFYVGDGVTLGGTEIGPIAGSFVPTTRTLTINGTSYDLSANRTWSVGTVTSISGTGTVSGLTLSGSVSSSGSLTLGGALTLTSLQVTSALGFTPYSAANPSGYISSITGLNISSLTNDSGYITSSALSGYLTIASAAATYQPIGSYLTTISGLNISLLTNDSGYITSSALTGYLTSASAASTYYPLTNPSGYITSSALSGYLTSATAASTYYPLTNPSSYISGITGGMVTTALGYTPYDDTNPAGYTTNLGTVTNVTGTSPISVATGTSTPVVSISQATTSVSGYLSSTDWNTFNGKQAALGFTPYNATNPAGYITSTALAPYLPISTAASTYQPIGAYLTSISGLNISLLTNDSGYITTAALSGYLTSATAASTYFPIPTGTGTQYITGTGALATFPTVGTWGALNYPAWATGSPFVKMTSAGTFALDTNTYLTSLSGAALLSQTSPQTIGNTTDRLAKLWATDITVTNPITGSVTGNAGTVTNATLTTGLTVNTGTVTLTGNASNNSVLTLGAGASSVSGTNTGDNAVNSNYSSDYRAANFVAGTNYLSPTGSAAGLTSFPTLNQNTTGNAASVTGLTLTTNLTNNGGAGVLTWPAAGATLTVPTGGGTLGTAAFTASSAYQPTNTNLTSVAGLSYVSPSFVKMTTAGTFALDTNTYLSSITSLDVTTALTYTPVNKAGDTMTGLLQFSGTTHAGLKLLSLTTVQRAALTPVAGMMVFDTDLATTCTYNGTNWEYTIKKIATLTTTAVITAANITGLGFAVEANSTYEIDGYYLAGCSGVGGVKFTVTVPASTTFDALFDSVAATVATSVKARTASSGSLTATASITAVAQGGVIVKGFIKVGVTAGTVQMQFASGTAAQTSTLYATSFCKLSKIA